MYFIPPKRPKCAVLFIRTDPDKPSLFTAELQEQQCRKYCSFNKIPVSHSVIVHCGSAEALDVMRYMLRTLPPQVDTIFAAEATCYSELLPDLALVCMEFQCRKTWVYSLDVPGTLYPYLINVTPGSLKRADKRYLRDIK